MKTLVLWGNGSVEAARARRDEGASFVLWDEQKAGQLREAGVAYRTRRDYLGPDGDDLLDEAAMAWTKAFGKRPLLDGQSLRELLTWKGVSLWWFVELYLYHSTDAPDRVRQIETLHRLLEAERPDEVEAVGLDTEDALLLQRTATACRVLYHGPQARAPLALATRVARIYRESRFNTAKALATAVKASLSGPLPRPARQAGRETVLFLSHAAFWQERSENGDTEEQEHYFGRIIPAVGEEPNLAPFVVAVGPGAAFRRRGPQQRLSDWLRLPGPRGPFVHINRYSSFAVFRELRRATREIRAGWRRLKDSPGLREAFAYRDVNFADLSGPALAGSLLLQLPWAVRCYEEMRLALRAVRPAVLCLYAESSGWGRAALAACRAEGVSSLGLQHGILYPKYFSYRHAADESDCPIPDRTAVFGEAASRLLAAIGNYPPESLTVTGSPKFDALLAAARTWDREATRGRLGVVPSDKLVVVASRFRAIRETHQSIGTAFPSLLTAVEAMAGVRCLVKPHPAEPKEAYEAAIRDAGASRTTVVSPGTDLMELLHAADALITVESLSAIEALVLGRPVLVLNMPTNLRDLVESGAALGAASGTDPRLALDALLFDPGTRAALDEARERYLSQVAHGVDGQATARIVALLRETAFRAERGSF
ncbi:MAG TPA: CDP-glycerol glycerophosphotransferase family protein [Vicinamibacteria bacterium]|nr:CDP-glycerol glycerophosphotransferase family protein [Vicinamibacteria bacterium]